MAQRADEPRVIAAMRRFRAQLLGQERKAAARIVRAYGTIYEHLQTNIKALEADIAALGETATRGQVLKLARYRALLSDTKREMDKYGIILENEIAQTRRAAVVAGLRDSQAAAQLALPMLPQRATAAIMARWNRVPVEAVENMLGALTRGSPLSKLLDGFGNTASKQIGDALLEGVALGYNPRKVAAKIRQELGGNLTRALRISRTEVLRAYRTASLTNYQANADVVKGWRWLATPDERTCMACIALDGREFALDKSFFPGHVNCRCTAEPLTISYQDMGLNVKESGQGRELARDWFGTLSGAQQQAMMGKGKYEAYKAGKIGLDDFIKETHNDDWGDSFGEASLADMLGAN